jgi:hypothetical protein
MGIMKTIKLIALAAWLLLLVAVSITWALPQQTYGTVALFSLNRAGFGYDADDGGTSVVNEDWTGAMHLEVPDFCTVTTTYATDYAFFGISWDRATYPLEAVSSTTYVIDIGDALVIPDTAGTETLPDATECEGHIITIKSNVAGSVTIDTVDGQTVDGTTAPALSGQYDYLTVVSDGSNWLILGKQITAM